MAGLVTTGFHHITLTSANAARTIAFYQEVLGFTPLPSEPARDNAEEREAPRSLLFGDAAGTPGTLLAFDVRPETPHGRAGWGGVHHLAFGVDSYEAQLKWKRWLTGHGLRVSGPMPRGYFTSLYFTDPDGQVLEIATAGPGYAWDEPIDALGREVMQPSAAQLPGGRNMFEIQRTTSLEPVEAITPDMRLSGLHHVSGMTDDIVRASEFYHEALGLSLVKKTINQDDPDTPHWFWANYDGTQVLPHSSWTLFGWSPRHPRMHYGTGQTQRVAFRATNAEEQLAWREHLLTMGLDVSPVIDHGFGTALHFQAPDGQALAITTDTRGEHRS